MFHKNKKLEEKINVLNERINNELPVPILIQLYLKDILKEIQIGSFKYGDGKMHKDIFKYEIRNDKFLLEEEIISNIEKVEIALLNRKKELNNER